MPEGKLYLPKQADGYDDALDHVCNVMARVYGGYTCYDGTGGWVDGDGEVVEEPVTVIETITSDERAPDLRDDVEQLAVDVKVATDECEVLGAVDGEKIMVGNVGDPTPEYDRRKVKEWARTRDDVTVELH